METNFVISGLFPKRLSFLNCSPAPSLSPQQPSHPVFIIHQQHLVDGALFYVETCRPRL